MDFPTLFTMTLAIVTLAGNIALVAFLLLFVVARPLFTRVVDLIGARATSLSFLVASVSTVGSLIYSEVVGFPACILCWVQRIFMYPQMFLYWLGIIRRESVVLPYGLLLSILGGVVALYHWGKDMLALYAGVVAPCPASVGLPSCDRIYVLEFGYVTIPMIALNAFLWLIVILSAGIMFERKRAGSTRGNRE